MSAITADVERKAKRAAYMRMWYANNKSKMNAWAKRYRQANPEKISEIGRAWREENKPRKAANDAKYAASNKEALKNYKANWYTRNRDRIAEKARDRRRRAPDVYAVRSQKQYRYKMATNPEALRAPARARSKARWRNDPLFRLHSNMRCLFRYSLKQWIGHGRKGGRSLSSIVGWSIDELANHLERQFVRGMSWDDFLSGRVHVDHITPLASFRISGLSDPELRRAWGLANLRPVWAKENLKKSKNRVFLL